jgi:hypothetical protein
MRTCPLNTSLFLSWLRLIWMVGEALDVGRGDSDRAASYQEQTSQGSKSDIRLSRSGVDLHSYGRHRSTLSREKGGLLLPFSHRVAQRFAR